VLSAIDCLSWAAVIVSTGVLDKDGTSNGTAGDGVPDKVEDGTVTTDPNGRPLPNLPAMGGSANHKDVYVEFGWMTTEGWPAAAPGDVGEHDHRPSEEGLKMVFAAFKNAGINAHFDVGANYQPASTPTCDPAAWTFECAIVPWSSDPNTSPARGGETIVETACSASAACDPLVTELGTEGHEQFWNFPGTVGWKRGYQYYRDAWVADADGAQLSDEAEVACEATPTPASCKRHRFDPNRMDIFHYALWAHALGLRLPCVTLEGQEVDFPPNSSSCGAPNVDNPNFHTPPKSSGFGDKGGGDLVVTLSAFGFNYNGADIVQAGTLLHELGHGFDLAHSGREPGETPESNCKPNYVSMMNYLFQVHGIRMIGVNNQPVLGVDLSSQKLGSTVQGATQLKESNPLSDGTLKVLSGGNQPQYPTRWYAPQATSFVDNGINGLNTTPAAKHCDGSIKDTAEPATVRVDAINPTAAIDWLNDGDITDQGLTQDINFNGGPNSVNGEPTDGPFSGHDDWTYVKAYGLRQVGSRPNMGELSLELSLADLGRGDPGRGDPGRGDPGRGDPGRGDPGRGDPGRGDPGRGDPGRGDPGAPPGDLDFDSIPVHGPQLLTAGQVLKTVQLNWTAPFLVPQGSAIARSWLYRIEAATLTPASFATRVLIQEPTPINPLRTSAVDEKPQNGRTYIYIVFVDYINPTARSGIAVSNAVPVKF
jgi:hypothetical protein